MLGLLFEGAFFKGDLSCVSVCMLSAYTHVCTQYGSEYYYFFQTLQCDHTKQRITGRLVDGTAFPLTVQFSNKHGDNAKNGLPVTYSGKITVYSTLSGMISFLPDGKIHGCNHHFVLMLTGFTADQLKGKVSSTIFNTMTINTNQNTICSIEDEYMLVTGSQSCGFVQSHLYGFFSP